MSAHDWHEGQKVQGAAYWFSGGVLRADGPTVTGRVTGWSADTVDVDADGQPWALVPSTVREV